MAEVGAEDLGRLVWLAVHKGLSSHAYFSDQAIAIARKHWGNIEPYYQRRIICDVQVALAMNSASTAEAIRDPDGLVVPRRRLDNRDAWELFAKELEPPKAAYTIDYHCHCCQAREVKLWRPYGSGQDLKCARCLAPDITIEADGRSVDGHGLHTDQIKDWVPAVPVGDLFWGYTSVPSADVRWWRELPTYGGTS